MSHLSQSHESQGQKTPTNSPMQTLLEQRQKVERDRLRSRPKEQFKDEAIEEEARLEKLIGKRDGNTFYAREIVAMRWFQQGLWRKEFIASSEPAKWKHEDPLSLEPECEAVVDANESSQSREAIEDFKNMALPSLRECEREASRPVNRFGFHIAVERERLLQDILTPRGLDLSPADPSESPDKGLDAFERALGPVYQELRDSSPPEVNSEAFRLVRARWQQRGIWDNAWGQEMPGMSWKHERPFEDLLCEVGLEEDCDAESPKGADFMGSSFGSVSYDGTDPGLHM